MYMQAEKLLQGKLLKHVKCDELQMLYLQYGINVFVNDTTNFIIIIILGLLFHELLLTLLFLVLFSSLRVHCGGYHAKTKRKCMSIFVLCYLAVITFTIFKPLPVFITLFLTFFSGVFILYVSPIIHPDNPLTDEEFKKNKMITVILTICYTILSLITFQSKPSICYLISAVLISTAILCAVELIKRKVTV